MEILVSIVIVLVGVGADAFCPDWEWFNGTGYCVTNERMEWAEHKIVCTGTGGGLWVPGSDSEQDFISDMVAKEGGSYHFWIDCLKSSSGDWVHSDGTPCENVYWHSTFPRGYQCAFWYLPNRHWYDQPCSRKLYAICSLHQDVNPGDTESTVNPVDTESTTNPIDAESTVDPVDTESTFNPVDTESTVNPVDSEFTNPIDTESTVNPINTMQSTVDPVDIESTVNPVDTESTVDPVDIESTVNQVGVNKVAAPSMFCLKTDADGRLTSQCLTGHVIKEFSTTKGVIACGSACRDEPRCRSFNLCQVSRGEKICQLNDISIDAGQNDKIMDKSCYNFDI